MDKPDSPPSRGTPELASKAVLSQLAGTELPGWDSFAPTVARLRVDASSTIFESGCRHPYVYVVLEGLVKLVYLRADGDAWIKSFIGAGQFFASLSALQGGLTSFAAETLEPMLAERLDFNQLQARAAVSLPWQRALTQALLIYGARKEARERDLLTLSATERYEALLREAPHVSQRLRQQDLARYLGITPVSLSRIKAQRRQARG